MVQNALLKKRWGLETGKYLKKKKKMVSFFVYY